MEGSLANKEQAEKCRDMAKNFLQQGEHQKAVRFFEKSLRLYPLPGVESLRDVAKVGGPLRGVVLLVSACVFEGLAYLVNPPRLGIRSPFARRRLAYA